MKKLMIGLIAGGFLLAMTGRAFAFTAIGSLIISAMLATGTAGLLPAASAAAIGMAALGGALFVANVAANIMLMNRRPKVNPNEMRQTTAGQEGPGRWAFGRAEIAADVGFGNTAGYNIYRLLFHCFGEMDGVEEYFYDGIEITVDPGTGAVSSPPWTRVIEEPGFPPTFSTETNMFIKTRPGDGSETAWSELMSDFPGKWTSDHRARGICQSLLRIVNPGQSSEDQMRRFGTLLTGGVSDLRIQGRFTKPWDPRDGQTRWTRNGVLICLHFMRQLPGYQDDALFDFDDIALTADESDVLVPTLDGTAPRCRLSGGWRGPLTTEIVEDMLESAGLMVRVTEEGKLTLKFIEDNPEPEITLFNRHIIDRQYNTGMDAASRPNLVHVTYFSPERRYQVAEIPIQKFSGGSYAGPAWARITGEIEKYGEQEQPIELIFCDNVSQAQRIARRLFHEAIADQGMLKTTFAGLACWGKRTAMIEFPDVGEDGGSVFKKCRIGPIRVNDNEGTCEVPFLVIPDELLNNPWSPATMEVPPPPVLPIQQSSTDLPTPSAPNAIIQVRYPGGAWELRVQFTVPGSPDYREVVYRTYDDNDPELPGLWTAATTEASIVVAYAAGDFRGDRVSARSRIGDSDGDISHWSDVLTVESVAVDNSVPSAPTLVTTTSFDDGTGQWADHITLTTDAINAVRGEIIGVHDEDIRPGQTIGATLFGFSDPGPRTYEGRVLTTDGTPSPNGVG